MNSKDAETVERFVELRAQGLPFARIATELAVSKPTLIAWSRKHQHRIRNLRALEADAHSEKCRISRQFCLENLGEDLRRIREELARRDLADVPTARLYALAALLRTEANRINGPLQLAEPLPPSCSDPTLIPDPTVVWEA